LYFNKDEFRVEKAVEYCEKDALLKMAGDVAAV
jgi:hypothetical protein